MKNFISFLKRNSAFVLFFFFGSMLVVSYISGHSKGVLICEIAMTMPKRNFAGAVARNNGAQVTAPSNIMVAGKDQQLNGEAELLSANVGGDVNTITVIVTSDAGGNNTPVFLWNTGAGQLGNLVNDNGGGAGTIAYGWDDNTFNGAIDNAIVTSGRQGKGLICYRVDFELFVDGLSDPANIATLRPVFLTYDAFANGDPNSMNTAAGHTRMDLDKGIVNMYCIQNISPFTQMKFTMPSSAGAVTNNVANVTFYFNRQYANR